MYNQIKRDNNSTGNQSLSLLLLSFKTLLKKVWLARHLPFLIPFISAPSTCITYSRGGRQHKGPSIWNVNCAASQLRSENVCIMRWGTCSSFIASLGGPLVYQMMLSIKSFHHRNPHNPSPPRGPVSSLISLFLGEKKQKKQNTQGQEPCRS